MPWCTIVWATRSIIRGKGRAAFRLSSAPCPVSASAAKADALNRMGDIRQGVADFDGAALCYNRALETDNSDYAALQLARMKGYGRDYVGKIGALDDFERRFASSPLIPDALLERTQALISTGCNDDAIAVYRRLIADYPATSQGAAHTEMAMTLLDSGRTDEALAAYRTVISLFPHLRGRPRAAALLKNLYVEQGRAADYMAFMSRSTTLRVSMPPTPRRWPTHRPSTRGRAAARRRRPSDFARRYRVGAPAPRWSTFSCATLPGAAMSPAKSLCRRANGALSRQPLYRGRYGRKGRPPLCPQRYPRALAVWEQLVEHCLHASVATVAR